MLSAAKTAATRVLSLWHPQRRAQLYCVGTGKSGTHSIAALFDDTVRWEHEVAAEELIYKILDRAEGRIDEPQIRRYVRERDRRFHLEVDSSNLNCWVLEFLLEEFKKAKFVLTIREPHSWLNSIINHSLGRPASPAWERFRRFRFQANGSVYAPEEQILKERGLYSLDGYLSSWAMHNQKVLDSVPADRLLVVRTNQITERAYEIGDFAGLPRRTVRPERSHSFKAPVDFQILKQIDPSFIAARVAQHCMPLIRKYFAESISYSADSRHAPITATPMD
jgi:hypothetical protein